MLDVTKLSCFSLMAALKNQKNCLINTIPIRRYVRFYITLVVVVVVVSYRLFAYQLQFTITHIVHSLLAFASNIA